MSKSPNNTGRNKNSTEKEKENKKRSTILALLLKGLQDGLSGTIGKWVGIVLTFIVVAVGGWALNNTYINPVQVREISGYVHEIDSKGNPLPGAAIFVVGQKGVQFEADENGYFSSTISVRKNTGQIILSCSLDGYEFFQKPVDIPVDKGEPIITNFQLEPL